MKFHWQEFLEGLDAKDARIARRNLELPSDMVVEIERLGEDRAQFEYWMREEGVECARLMLTRSTDAAALFDKWFPILQQFAREKRLANPAPDDKTFTVVDHAIGRILRPKIKNDGGLPQLRKHRVPVFSAPAVVLPFVIAEWSQSYENPIFLTPAELREWQEVCDEPENAPWWSFFFIWDAELNPLLDQHAMPNERIPVPEGTTLLLISWGSCVGALAGSWSSELWCIDAGGTEVFIADLGRSVA